MSSLGIFKEQFAKKEGLIHLNNAGLSPITKVARDKVIYWTERFYQEGYYTDADYKLDLLDSKSNLAKLIGCRAEEIAWFTNTASAISQFAFQIGLRANDEVVMWDQEYVSNLYPFKQACDLVGAKLKLVSSDVDLSTPTEKYIEAITSKTKIAAFSSVQFSSGARMDAAAVIAHCKKLGVITFADIIQELGVHPLKVWSQGIDAVAGGSHKWLASPVGVGYLAIRPDLTSKMKPHSYGSGTFGTCDDATDLECKPKVDASKFEPSSKQVLEITALGASCKLFSEVGIEVIETEALRLARLLISESKKLSIKINSPFKGEHLSPMVNLKIPDEKIFNVLVNDLKEQNINFALRGGGMRFSPHAFNTETEIHKLISIFKKYFN
ncbi:MAG: aminotransferase class V-fold PLP-dependent enzyme [Bdellovibrionales bacterium]|nr:aminotransferase class V-fold PLP-dependent enzyme [Bdellovibrionales bacterium]